MSKTSSVFCPLCAAGDGAVLAAMSVTFIMVAPIDRPEHERPPYFDYRCERCGFGEIHKRVLESR